MDKKWIILGKFGAVWGNFEGGGKVFSKKNI